MAKYECTTCGQEIEPEDTIRIGCRLYPDMTQSGISYVVKRPREIFLFHEAHAPLGGYQLRSPATLAAELADGQILDA
jgi:hypothetical protein